MGGGHRRPWTLASQEPSIYTVSNIVIAFIIRNILIALNVDCCMTYLL